MNEEDEAQRMKRVDEDLQGLIVEDDDVESQRREHYDALSAACQRANAEEVEQLLLSLGTEAPTVVNGSLSGSNTLLFKACEEGHEDIVNLLLQYGADGRIHPVTKYSPLFIACYHGRKSIVRSLLDRFPELANVATVERWLPLHAATINNHVEIVEMLLTYRYPDRLLRTFQDPTKTVEYQFAFDLNTQDVSAQTALYMAAFLGNQRLVELLLNLKLPAARIGGKQSSEDSSECDTESMKSCDSNSVRHGTNSGPNTAASSVTSPTGGKLRSSSIQSIISRLSQSGRSDSMTEPTTTSFRTEPTVCPIDVNVYCCNQTETALHVAIKTKHYSIASQLLQSGATPNLPILASNNDIDSGDNYDGRYSSTSLKEACKNRDASMIDLLIRYGARDDDCQALQIAASNSDNHLMSKLLALKSFADPEFKINRKAIELPGLLGTNMLGSVTYSSMFPTTPVMINWHSLGCLTNIRKQWLVDASIAHNIKLKLNLQNQTTSLLAITRLDLSNNGLTSLPLCLFQMPSLRIFVLSQNKLESLPEFELEPSTPTQPSTFFSNRMKKSHSYSVSLDRSTATRGPAWQLPCLEELHLQDNRLESVPPCLFELPQLQLLDLSNNKLRYLPYKMWFSPKLRDLNLSMNLLRDLPARIVPVVGSTGPHNPLLAHISPTHSKSVSTESSDPETPTTPGAKPRSKDSLLSTDDLDDLDGSPEPPTDNTKLQALRHLNLWTQEIQIMSTNYLEDQLLEKNQTSKLSLLNLSHNGFTTVPKALSCMATSLTRINLSYNCLTSIGSVKLFPANLKHLDLSFNQLNSWSRVDLDPIDALCCGSLQSDPSSSDSPAREPLGSSPVLKPKVRNIYCIHKQHTRLDNLRSLVLANNHLHALTLVTDSTLGPVTSSHIDTEDFEQLDISEKFTRHTRLLFPNISMLDLSNNQIREIPLNVSELYNLSVLHLSGNRDICRLPPQMGLLSKLWNLSLRGCNLNEPLKSMVESKKYKTMDIIGYLKSILEDAKPYARMKLMVVGVQGIGKTSLLEQLRQEGTGSYRRRPPEHWGKRMGNKNLNMKTPKGVTMSTVGVDVCDWTYERKGRDSFGPVTFRTWDFGGQKEYYSTHQYFLSKRSLYLVLYKMIDGEKAVLGIQQWLVNIQARAPNAPVIIVGTHYDLIKEFYPPFYAQELQATIREKFINIVDPDKCGLPRVIDSIEVSTKTRHNIKLLCNVIYDTVFGLRCPGSKERLLEQRIPATYLALEDVIGYLAAERRADGKDPVLRAEDYKQQVMAQMQRRFRINFRDVAELQQATAFLHDNGVLLHYEDSTLKDLYFLDPQWLCDILAHVVTIREINPYAKNGIMNSDDLKHLFKASSCAPIDAKTYIINLLNKFEVALTWDSRTLLIPSLLPTEQNLILGAAGCDVRIPVRSRGWVLRGPTAAASARTSMPSSSAAPEASKAALTEKQNSCEPGVTIQNRPERSVYRLLIMTYFPSGFWSRLMTRLLGDDFIIEIIRSYYQLPKEAIQDPFVISALNRKAEWSCWQTGLSLRYMNSVIFRCKEILPSVQNQPIDYSLPLRFLLQHEFEERWLDLELHKSSILEIYLPNHSVQIQTTEGQQFLIEPSQECIAKLLALTVDHIDTLLEDWYPSLGTRFVHTSEGRFLVTRLVPCIKCLNQNSIGTDHPPIVKESPPDTLLGPRDFMSEGLEQQGPRQHAQSVDSTISRDSDIGYESAGSKRASKDIPLSTGTASGGDGPDQEFQDAEDQMPVVYTFMVEECILRASEEKPCRCPVHGDLHLRQIAPDVVFVDLGDHYIIKPEHVRRGKMLGRGAFGFVFKASIKQRSSQLMTEVAMKMLQPVDPGHGARQSDNVAFKVAWNKWERDPMQYSCKAYTTARQELNILLSLKHPHIVPLIGVCARPLALILSLAPLGALDLLIKEYRRSGIQINAIVIQKILLQVSKALEYLHQQHIIYRDLKSENVLVWKLPLPYEPVARAEQAEVDVKVADYGISRSTLPTGTKGFGGTEGFMAPEIMRHNGEEEYTEKVDCFSFGMFVFELVSLHLPFEGQESIKDHILDGGRPPLSPRDLCYPSYLLDLMSLCWAEAAKDRPGASQIVSIVSAPEFIHMLDCVALAESQNSLLSAAIVSHNHRRHHRRNQHELWLTRVGKQTDVLCCNQNCWTDYKTVTNLDTLTITASCVVPEENFIYLGDSKALIHVYITDGSYIEKENFRLDPNDDTPTAVRSILHSRTLDSLLISSTSGRLWICHRQPNSSQHLLREIGNNDVPFLSMTSLDQSATEGESELWCGQTEGRICVISIRNQDRMIRSQEVLNHYADDSTPVLERLDVFDLVGQYPNVWSYMYPGCIVYHWDVLARRLMHRVDLSKLAPCSESLMSMSIDEHLTPGKCQVTAMAVLRDELYIGTAWGCLVIVEGPTMRPITVFRPHEDEIKAIVAFESADDPKIVTATSIDESAKESDLIAMSTNSTTQSHRPRYLITVGKGFRSLVSRYVYLSKEKRAHLSQRGTYACLWKTGNWLFL